MKAAGFAAVGLAIEAREERCGDDYTPPCFDAARAAHGVAIQSAKANVAMLR
jgi:hypothetical protein